MIDFRYHLVSLTAVLVALAVGIVLGAGPLNDGIGNTLSGEVTRLRAEKDALRDELSAQERAGERRDDYDQTTLPAVLQGRLSGQQVTVVALPQVEDGEVEDVTTALDEAGAEVAEPVRVDRAWATHADGDVADRAKVGSAALGDLGLTLDDQRGSVEADDELGPRPADQAFAAVLAGRGGPRGPAIAEGARAAAWARLSDADLLAGPAEAPAPADLVVVLAAPISGGAPEGDDPDPAATATARHWVQLAADIDAAASGSVLAGSQDVGGSGRDVSVITTARADPALSEGVSTVDAPSLPVGRAAIVMASQEQLRGESGAYGIGPDASSAIPATS